MWNRTFSSGSPVKDIQGNIGGKRKGFTFLRAAWGEKIGTRKSISYDHCTHVFAVKGFTINGLVISSAPRHSTAINHPRISSHRPAALLREVPRLTSMLSIWNLNASPRDIFCISQLPRSSTATSIIIIISVTTITACAQPLYLEGAEQLPKQSCVEWMSPGRQPTLGGCTYNYPFSTASCRY